MKISWVSPYSVDNSDGGWKGMNHHLYTSLSAILDCPIFPVLPKYFDIVGMTLSRLLTLVRGKRLNWTHSNATLSHTASAFTRIAQQIACASDGYFFFGSSPYLQVKPARPYFCYLDSGFVPYLHFYEQKRNYLAGDLARLAKLESAWLQGCSGIFTSSEFARQKLIEVLNISGRIIHVVGAGPNLDFPPQMSDHVTRGSDLIFIAADFKRKGGKKLIQAINIAQAAVPSIHLHCIGEKPSCEYPVQFVTVHGWLDRRMQKGKEAFDSLMQGCGLSVMLSFADLTPLALCESFAYGLPCLASSVGGIPEMIHDGENGWLVSPDASAAEIAEILVRILSEPQKLQTASSKARECFDSFWNWSSVAQKIAIEIQCRLKVYNCHT